MTRSVKLLNQQALCVADFDWLPTQLAQIPASIDLSSHSHFDHPGWDEEPVQYPMPATNHAYAGLHDTLGYLDLEWDI